VCRYSEKDFATARVSLLLMHIGMVGGENVANHQGNGERRQAPRRRLLRAIGRPPQQRAILIFEQAGRDFKKLLITTQ